MAETSRASLGFVTSYGAARRGGYTGTYEEWCALMAEVADHLEQNESLYADTTTAKEAAEAAQGYAEVAQGKAEDAQTAAETAQGKAEDAQTAAETAQGKAEDAEDAAEAWAAGTSGGTPSATNNASYYAGQASDSATASAASAASAEAWATGGSGGTASASNNAKYYSEQAATSATAAEAVGTNFAPTFSSSSAYSAGDYVMYNGTQYRFTANHAAGAWTGSDAVAEPISPVVADLKTQIEQMQSRTRNMFDPQYFLDASGWEESNGVYTGTASALNSKYGNSGILYPVEDGFASGERYTISLTAKTDGSVGTTGDGIRVYFVYTDNSNGSVNLPNDTSAFTDFQITSASGKTVAGIRFTYGTNGNNVWEIKNVQLEKGTSKTEFIPYKVPNDQIAREDIENLNENLDDLIENLNENLDDLIEKIDLTQSRTRNMFDAQYLLAASGWTESGGVYSGPGTNLNSKYGLAGVAYPVSDSFESNTQYTISLLAKTNGASGTSGEGLRVYFVYTDNSNSAVAIPNSTSVFTNFKLTSASGKTVASIRFTYGSNGDNVWEIKNIQLEKGLKQTEFINYKVPNDETARENIANLQKMLQSYYANAIMKTVSSGDAIHVQDASTVDSYPLVSVRRINLLDPVCNEYLSFSGSAGSYTITSSEYKNANIVDVSNLNSITISGDLSGFGSSVFRYAFTSDYPAAGVSTSLGNGTASSGTTLVVPETANYLIWYTGSSSITSISSEAILNVGSTAATYSAYITDITTVSVTVDTDGVGTNAQTKYADSNGDVSGFIVNADFYAYSSDAVDVFVTYIVDTVKAIQQGSGGYIDLVGDADTFSMTAGTDQSGALTNAKNIAVGNGNMENATATKCMTLGIENMVNVTGEQNTSFGYHSLFRVTSGRFNVAFGNESLDDNTEGVSNSAFGAYSLQRNSKGVNNTAVGYQALRGGYGSFNQNAKFDYNTAIGTAALIAITTGYSNVAIGADALKALTTGNSNVAIGNAALDSVTSGSHNTAIGKGSDVASGNINNSIMIGENVTATASNQIRIGTVTHDSVIIAGKVITFNQDGSVTWAAET